MSDDKFQIQETHRITNIINTKVNTLRHINFKLWDIKIKQKSQKKKEEKLFYVRKNKEIKSDFF